VSKSRKQGARGGPLAPKIAITQAERRERGAKTVCSFSLSAGDVELIEELAAERGASKSEVVSQALAALALRPETDG
jgi:hypothetical protein